MSGRADWLENFQAWVARLSPSALAGLQDVLARELHERNAGESGASGEAARRVRARQRARVSQLVDDFLLAPASDARTHGQRSVRGTNGEIRPNPEEDLAPGAEAGTAR